MTRSLAALALAAALSLPFPAAAAEPAAAPAATPTPTPTPEPAPARWIEPRAEELLRRMSERLARAPRFALEAEETFDEVPDGEPRRSLSNVRRVAVVRPDRFAADGSGDSLDRATWYDGSKITILDRARNRWVQVDAPPTLDAAFDLVAQKYRLVFPLADLIYSDPAAVLLEGATYGRYLGLHRAAGVPCHHLVFAQAEIEWQIWIDAGPDPLPRRFAISYVKEAGEPQYSATIVKWNLEPKFGEDLFRFVPPAGSKRVELGR